MLMPEFTFASSGLCLSALLSLPKIQNGFYLPAFFKFVDHFGGTLPVSLIPLPLIAISVSNSRYEKLATVRREIKL
jgi:hypothetical protein